MFPILCKIILSSFPWIFVVFIPVLAKGLGTRKIYFCSAYFITNPVEPYVLDPEEAYLRNLQFPLRVLQSLWVPLWFLVHREESYFIWAELPFLVCHLYFQFLHLLLQVNDRKIFLANGAADFINGPNILLRKQSKKLGHSEAAVQRCSQKKMFWKNAANLQESTHDEVQFQWIFKQLYWNHTLAWMFSCKFAAYFQNIFS